MTKKMWCLCNLLVEEITVIKENLPVLNRCMSGEEQSSGKYQRDTEEDRISERKTLLRPRLLCLL